MSTARRSANITDSLRLLGALCVVWYHNPLYWGLQAYTPVVDGIKLVLLGWSMPFFYVTSAKFSFAAKTPARRLARMATILALIFFYTALYELAHWNNANGLAAHCLVQSGDCSIGFIANTVRNVGNTPGYYLSDLLSMYILALVAGIHPVAGWILTGLAWCAFLAGYGRFDGFFLNPLALGCLCFALTYRQLLAVQVRRIRPVFLAAATALAALFLIPLAWGIANYFWGQNDYWRDGGRIALFGILLLVFLSLDDITDARGALMQAISEWGRRYAFGIFIFHQLCFDLLASRTVVITQRFFHVNDALSLYIVTGLIATLSAIALTAMVRKIASPLLAS